MKKRAESMTSMGVVQGSSLSLIVEQSASIIIGTPSPIIQTASEQPVHVVHRLEEVLAQAELHVVELDGGVHHEPSRVEIAHAELVLDEGLPVREQLLDVGLLDLELDHLADLLGAVELAPDIGASQVWQHCYEREVLLQLHQEFVEDCTQFFGGWIFHQKVQPRHADAFVLFSLDLLSLDLQVQSDVIGWLDVLIKGSGLGRLAEFADLVVAGDEIHLVLGFEHLGCQARFCPALEQVADKALLFLLCRDESVQFSSQFLLAAYVESQCTWIAGEFNNYYMVGALEGDLGDASVDQSFLGLLHMGGPEACLALAAQHLGQSARLAGCYMDLDVVAGSLGLHDYIMIAKGGQSLLSPMASSNRLSANSSVRGSSSTTPTPMPSFFISHFFRSSVSRNRLSRVLHLSTTTTNCRPESAKQLAKQLPAVSVTPVFIPQYSRLPSSRWVLAHWNSWIVPSVFVAQELYSLVLTISRNIQCFMAYLHSWATSSADDLFRLFESPCGFAYLVFLRLRVCARAFISLINVLMASLFFRGVNDSPESRFSASFLPAQTASAKLASLPLGSISPQMRSLTVYRYPLISPALVPVILVSTLPIRTDSSNCCFEAILSTTKQVIILVRLAISRLVWLFQERCSFSGSSRTIYEQAVRVGGGSRGRQRLLIDRDFGTGRVLLCIDGGRHGCRARKTEESGRAEGLGSRDRLEVSYLDWVCRGTRVFSGESNGWVWVFSEDSVTLRKDSLAWSTRRCLLSELESFRLWSCSLRRNARSNGVQSFGLWSTLYSCLKELQNVRSCFVTLQPSSVSAETIFCQVFSQLWMGLITCLRLHYSLIDQIYQHPTLQVAPRNNRYRKKSIRSGESFWTGARDLFANPITRDEHPLRPPAVLPATLVDFLIGPGVFPITVLLPVLELTQVNPPVLPLLDSSPMHLHYGRDTWFWCQSPSYSQSGKIYLPLPWNMLFLKSPQQEQPSAHCSFPKPCLLPFLNSPSQADPSGQVYFPCPSNRSCCQYPSQTDPSLAWYLPYPFALSLRNSPQQASPLTQMSLPQPSCMFLSHSPSYRLPSGNSCLPHPFLWQFSTSPSQTDPSIYCRMLSWGSAGFACFTLLLVNSPSRYNVSTTFILLNTGTEWLATITAFQFCRELALRRFEVAVLNADGVLVGLLEGVGFGAALGSHRYRIIIERGYSAIGLGLGLFSHISCCVVLRMLIVSKARRPISLVRMFSRLVVRTQEKLEMKKKKHNDLSELKKELQLYHQSSKTLFEETPHLEVYRRMDSSMDSFFRKRQYTLENFNFLLNVLAEQSRVDRVPAVLAKMSALGVAPNQTTYNYMIKAAGNSGDARLAQRYFHDFKKRFQPNKYIYTTLMVAYVRGKDAPMAQRILNEMTEQKLVPDIATMTTLMNAHLKSRNVAKCWELHKYVTKHGIPLDEVYVSVLMQVYAATHDTEKVIKLYREHIETANQEPLIDTVNSYLKALSARPDYAQQAIDTFFGLVNKGTLINASTILMALRACALATDMKSAVNVLKIMKNKGIAPNKYIYNGLMRCYASGCSVPDLPVETMDLFIEDAWRLLQEVGQANLIDTTLLNNFLLIFVTGLRLEEIQGLVLPLYEKYGLPKDKYTFEFLLRAFKNSQDMTTFLNVWDGLTNNLTEESKKYLEIHGSDKHSLAVRNNQFLPTFESVCMWLQTGVKLMDKAKILEALDMFKKLKLMPKTKHLQFLGELDQLPVQIQAVLVDFGLQFGTIKGKRKHVTPVEDPQNK